MKTVLVPILFTLAAIASASLTAAPDPAGLRTVSITANDSLKYSVTRIEARAGERIHLVLQNQGTLPKELWGITGSS